MAQPNHTAPPAAIDPERDVSVHARSGRRRRADAPSVPGHDRAAAPRPHRRRTTSCAARGARETAQLRARSDARAGPAGAGTSGSERGRRGSRAPPDDVGPAARISSSSRSSEQAKKPSASRSAARARRATGAPSRRASAPPLRLSPMSKSPSTRGAVEPRVELREVTAEVRHAVHRHDVGAHRREVDLEPARGGDDRSPVALALDEHHGGLRMRIRVHARYRARRRSWTRCRAASMLASGPRHAASGTPSEGRER